MKQLMTKLKGFAMAMLTVAMGLFGLAAQADTTTIYPPIAVSHATEKVYTNGVEVAVGPDGITVEMGTPAYVVHTADEGFAFYTNRDNVVIYKTTAITNMFDTTTSPATDSTFTGYLYLVPPTVAHASTSFIIGSGQHMLSTSGCGAICEPSPLVQVIYTADEGYVFDNGTGQVSYSVGIVWETGDVSITTAKEPMETTPHCLAPVYKTADDPTSGIDHWVTNTITSFTTVGSGRNPVTWNAGWYVVANDALLTKAITCKGAVNLLLCHGATLQAASGIVVTGDGNSLTIYKHVESTGTLVANADIYAAGIGGGEGMPGSAITINGGTVTATGGSDAAGIGGGKGGGGSNITINGGTVTATGASYAAGIGGGKDSGGSNITINGGTVAAAGGWAAAGIGGGYGGGGSNITINNGTIFVSSCSLAECIGGSSASSSNVKVASAANILFNLASSGATLTSSLTGCVLMTPETAVTHTLVGGCTSWTGVTEFALTNAITGATGTISVNGEEVVFANHYLAMPFADGKLQLKAFARTTINSPTLAHAAAKVYTNGVEVSVGASGVSVVQGTSAYVVYTTDDGYTFNGKVVVTNAIDTSVKPASIPEQDEPILQPQYLAPVYNTAGDPTSGIARWESGSVGVYTPVASSTDAASWGASGQTSWYVLASDAAIDYQLTINGTVNLILCQGATLTASRGIRVTGSNALTIYGQTDGAGALTAYISDGYAAGIGGGAPRESGANITINGGTVTATGGEYAAGIGGGWLAAGSNIRINGGTVIATGGDDGYGGFGDGIGNGYRGTGSSGIVISTEQLVKAGASTPLTTIIANDGTDLATKLAGLQYAQVEPMPPPTAILAQPTTVEHTTIAVYTNGVLSAETETGSGLWNAWSNETATVVYTVEEGYIFADGSTSVTYTFNTTVDPAVADAPKAQSNRSKYLVPVYKTADDATSGIDHWNTETVGGAYTSVESLNYGPTWSAGWYLVEDEVSIEGRITCNGAVHLLLCKGAKLTVSSGIGVVGSNSLTIYGQPDGAGTLEVTGTIGGYSTKYCSGANITINGGTVTATGTGATGAGIGGYGASGVGSNIVINGGTVTATGGTRAAGIGGGGSASPTGSNTGSDITINGGTVTATGGANGAGIGGGYKATGTNIRINGGTVIATGGSKSGAEGIGKGSGSSTASSSIFAGADEIVKAGASENPTTVIAHTAETDLAEDTSFAGMRYVVMTPIPRTNYLAPVYKTEGDVTSGIDHWVTNTLSEFTEVSQDVGTWAAGWYVVKSDVTVSGSIACSGAVHLILCKGATLTAGGGICVSGDGNSLEIYGQSDGDGTLVATGGSGCAGIGGANGSGGGVTINGGMVTATGGANAAGIGGGNSGNGSDLTINGGTVTATGGANAAGIGGGYQGCASSLTINGGTIRVSGDAAAQCIGCGTSASSSSDDVTISSSAKILFNLAGSGATLPSTFKGCAILTPATPVARTLVGGCTSWSGAQTFTLMSSASSATGTISVNGSATFADASLSLPFADGTLQLTASGRSTIYPPTTVEHATAKVYTNGVEVTVGASGISVEQNTPAYVVYTADEGYNFNGVMSVTNTIDTSGSPATVPTPSAPSFTYTEITVPSVGYATAKIYTNGVAVADATGLSVTNGTSAYVVYTADAGYLFTGGSSVVTNTIDTTTRPASMSGTAPVALLPVCRIGNAWYGSIADALAAITGSSATTITLVTNVTANVSIAASRNITFDLNGFVWKGTGSGTVISNPNGSTLTLTDTRTENRPRHYFTEGSNNLWVWNGDATVTDFYVDGGLVTGGKGSSGDNPGGVYTQGGTATMSNVAIVGNQITSGTGGGVRARNCTFTATGCKFVHNYASSEGGGIVVTGVAGSSFAIRDCEFIGNRAGTNGGGVRSWTMTMNSSLVSISNTVFRANVSGAGGGAISASTPVTLTDCEIAGNTSATKGALDRLAVGSTTYALTVAGTTSVTNNTGGNAYLASGTVLTVANGFCGKIGVTTATAPTETTPVSITGNCTADVHTHFVADNASYSVVNAANNVVQLCLLTNVTFTPTAVDHVTTTVYTNGAEVAAGASGISIAKGDSAYVVYTADEGYLFTDGSSVITNMIDTTVDPATVPTRAAPVWVVSYMAPVYATAGDPTSDVTGWTAKTVPLDYSSVATDTTAWGAAGATSWYVVASNVTIDSRIACKGAVNLVLCDGATLTAAAGLEVEGDGTLTVYGPAADTGALVVGVTESETGLEGSVVLSPRVNLLFDLTDGGDVPAFTGAALLLPETAAARTLASGVPEQTFLTTFTLMKAGQTRTKTIAVGGDSVPFANKTLTLKHADAAWTLGADDLPTEPVVTDTNGQTVDVTVPTEWRQQHGVMNEDAVDTKNPNENGMLTWHSYVLDLEPTNKLSGVYADVPQNGETKKVTIKTKNLEGHTIQTGYSVKYRLDKKLKGATAYTKGSHQASADFDVSVDGDDPTGLYQLNAVLFKGDTELDQAATAINTVGLVKATNTNKYCIVAVPWGKLAPGEEQEIAVSNVVKTANLTAGDKLHVYRFAKGTYDTWTLTSDGTWEPATSYKLDKNGKVTTETSGDPQEATIARGNGIWLERVTPTDKPYFLYGQYSESAPAVTLEKGYNLLAAPGLEAYDLANVTGATDGDQILVPGAQPKVYTYKKGQWGYYKTETTTINVKGTKQTAIKSVWKTDDSTIPAGTGFWLINKSGNVEVR